jgi:uncharacterized RDD family membrane protein YckC
MSAPAPPVEMTQMAFPRRLGLAGLWPRVGAMAIDLLVTALWAAPFRLIWRRILPDPYVLGSIRASGAVLLLLLWLYFVLTTLAWGGTVGKLLLGLRVVAVGGTRPDLLTVLFREVVGRVLVTASLGIGYLWAAADPRHQGWHDKVADTLVLGRIRVVDLADPWAPAAGSPPPPPPHRADATTPHA